MKKRISNCEERGTCATKNINVLLVWEERGDILKEVLGKLLNIFYLVASLCLILLSCKCIQLLCNLFWLFCLIVGFLIYLLWWNHFMQAESCKCADYSSVGQKGQGHLSFLWGPAS